VPAGTIFLRAAVTRTASGARKTFEVNGSAVGFARFLGRARVVTFVPADLQLVAGGPALRRTFLNGALAQLAPAYYRDLARYGKLIAQKAALLRGAIAPDRTLLSAYNDELVAPGAALIGTRAAFVGELAAAVDGVYDRWPGARERIEVAYAPNVAAALHVEPREALAAALGANAEAELRRKTTLVGPHRDDLRLTIDGRPLDGFGSQGQVRTAVLALKVAEYETMRSRAGDAPILLLDDVLSELDAERAGGFLAAVGAFEQAFLTTTEFPVRFGSAARFAIAAAKVTAC
jgi:DNA replication and repair protein RecF